ncbi:pyridoxamine 5'-phosphate oxidase family protein [Deinococcus cellulosilyticus]|uniref:Phosphohydrolase n=1 Tax=Deinococcus cellulosilyticus (strain DSM 18568 / NBRC 106333 / KACC 11606 / 5516J-15) TaxID=1223518 RepID=A0A511N9P5_DEIC1|nr:pyridoxamine 5'-phosphate oxidase family protein [Deinococcus cellulosilyticus]GEM49218.1 phosphohydrolase [Deinococcus cellulosilyticus NBRC 106333 = KACC 11606]
MPDFQHVVQSEDELNAILGGEPSELVKNKVRTRLDEYSRAFIASSPFIVLSTSNREGLCDASPKGDEAGFVKVLDDHTLLIPERPGNRLADGYRNVLKNPHVGILFFIPGKRETYRVNGSARIVTDPEVLEMLTAQGKVPKLALAVTVEECYPHCGKAVIRSKLWADQVDAAPEVDVAAMLAAQVNKTGVTRESVQQGLDESYRERLY